MSLCDRPCRNQRKEGWGLGSVPGFAGWTVTSDHRRVTRSRRSSRARAWRRRGASTSRHARHARAEARLVTSGQGPGPWTTDHAVRWSQGHDLHTSRRSAARPVGPVRRAPRRWPRRGRARRAGRGQGEVPADPGVVPHPAAGRPQGRRTHPAVLAQRRRGGPGRRGRLLRAADQGRGQGDHRRLRGNRCPAPLPDQQRLLGAALRPPAAGQQPRDRRARSGREGAAARAPGGRRRPRRRRQLRRPDPEAS